MGRERIPEECEVHGTLAAGAIVTVYRFEEDDKFIKCVYCKTQLAKLRDSSFPEEFDYYAKCGYCAENFDLKTIKKEEWRIT